MLRIETRTSSQYCDGVSRRNFLQIGAFTAAGISLPGLLKAEADNGTGSSQKAIINIHLAGGPSHQDMFDLKPDAPVEFRGDFTPIPTNVSGLEICEHFPKLATMAERFAVIRSLVGMHNQHSNYHTQSGWSQRSLENAGGRPALGSVVAKLQGPGEGGSPPYISYNGGEPGFLGPIFRPYRPSGNELRLHQSLSEERLNDRTSLLGSLDRMRRDVDTKGDMNALDEYVQQAATLVTAGKVADALDLNKEDRDVVNRYGRDGRYFLTARRLIEAGCRVVTFNWGGWDTHQQNFRKLAQQLPKLDQALSCLLDDLHDRGMEKDVIVIMWGEFGRTPRVNRNAGRDHWPRLSSCFIAGGDMQMGQAVGKSTRYAEDAMDRPVDLQEVFATLYHHFGIDAATTLLHDTNGRPQYLLDHRTPIRELIG